MIESVPTSTPPLSKAAWYALHTRYQHEKAIARVLTIKQFDVFLPQYTAIHHWKDRDRRISSPLFPCYVFIRGGLDRQFDVMTTPGIIGWVGACAPSPIPALEIEAMRRAVERIDKVEPHPYLACGDRVRVMVGPLAGIEGILVRKKNLFRLVLSVEILQRSASVEVDVSCVDRVMSAAPRAGSNFRSSEAGWAGAQLASPKTMSSLL